MKHKKPKPRKNIDMEDQVQHWEFSTLTQNVLEADGVAVNESIEDFVTNNPDYQYEICDEIQGNGFIFSTVLTAYEFDLDLSVDGKRRGVIIGGSRPPCNEDLDSE